MCSSDLMVNNNNLQYGVELIEGVNSSGEFCPPKANTIGINLKPYKIVNDGDFVYNPSRLNIGSLAYRDSGLCIVSHLYVVFRLKDNSRGILLEEFLLLYFKRKEFLRMIDYLNFGSQRPEFNFFDMCEIKIPLPSIEVQQELVDTYNGLKNLAEENEALIEPLSKACEAFIVDCKAEYPEVNLGEYIEICDERNSKCEYDANDVMGMTITKEIIPTKADIKKTDLSKFLIVQPKEFVYNPRTHGKKIGLGFNKTKKAFIISWNNVAFRVINEDKLIPNYLYMIICRNEWDRNACFRSWGSSTEVFSWSEFTLMPISLPPIEVQQSIVNLHRCLEEAKSIAAEAREKLKTLCPALVQRAINS